MELHRTSGRPPCPPGGPAATLARRSETSLHGPIRTALRPTVDGIMAPVAAPSRSIAQLPVVGVVERPCGSRLRDRSPRRTLRARRPRSRTSCPSPGCPPGRSPSRCVITPVAESPATRDRNTIGEHRSRPAPPVTDAREGAWCGRLRRPTTRPRCGAPRRPGDSERPAGMADAHRSASIADRRAVGRCPRRPLGDLTEHRVVDIPEAQQLMPFPPREGQRWVEREGLAQRAQRLVHHARSASPPAGASGPRST